MTLNKETIYKCNHCNFQWIKGIVLNEKCVFCNKFIDKKEIDSFVAPTLRQAYYFYMRMACVIEFGNSIKCTAINDILKVKSLLMAFTATKKHLFINDDVDKGYIKLDNPIEVILRGINPFNDLEPTNTKKFFSYVYSKRDWRIAFLLDSIIERDGKPYSYHQKGVYTRIKNSRDKWKKAGSKESILHYNTELSLNSNWLVIRVGLKDFIDEMKHCTPIRRGELLQILPLIKDFVRLDGKSLIVKPSIIGSFQNKLAFDNDISIIKQ